MIMKKKVKSFLLGCALFLSPMRMQAMLPDSLKEITRTYLGMYECKQLLLDGENKLDEFEYIKIELKSGGQMALYFADAKGQKGKAQAEYEYDEKAQTITVYTNIGNQKMKRTFPLKNGELFVHLIYETRTVTMKFEQN